MAAINAPYFAPHRANDATTESVSEGKSHATPNRGKISYVLSGSSQHQLFCECIARQPWLEGAMCTGMTELLLRSKALRVRQELHIILCGSHYCPTLHPIWTQALTICCGCEKSVAISCRRLLTLVQPTTYYIMYITLSGYGTIEAVSSANTAAQPQTAHSIVLPDGHHPTC
jgi:hypothetical protein